MAKTGLLLLIAGLAAGFAAVTWLQGTAERDEVVEPLGALQGSDFSNGMLPLEARVDQLEWALTDEVNLRLALQAELAALYDELQTLRGEPTERREESDARDERFRQRFGFSSGSDTPNLRLNQLMEGGFNADQAQRIMQRESELRMEALYAQYEAARESEPFDLRFDSRDVLRQELGDIDYERYLKATGQATSVVVQSVLASSPAQNAGLEPGDQIIRYAGRRVFSISDLNKRILEGERGQTVIMDVLRDSQQIQVYVPRGPIGITSGRRGFR